MESDAAQQFRVSCQLDYLVNGPSAFIFNLSVVQNAFQQIVEEAFVTSPQLPMEEVVSAIEEKRLHRFTIDGSGPLEVRYSATVKLTHFLGQAESAVEVPAGQLPAEVMPYLYPSRYCESDKLMRLAQHEFGRLQPGFSRVTAICNWMYGNVEYLSGSTNPLTSAFDTATERAGVCRDFAHLGVAFCRALGIPARFVSGYAFGLQPPDLHAYFEAFLGERWYLFDATRLSPQSSFIRIGTGRDAADTSFATIFGPVTFSAIKVTMEPVGAPPPYIDGAISTSEEVAPSSQC